MAIAILTKLPTTTSYVILVRALLFFLFFTTPPLVPPLPWARARNSSSALRRWRKHDRTTVSSGACSDMGLGTCVATCLPPPPGVPTWMWACASRPPRAWQWYPEDATKTSVELFVHHSQVEGSTSKHGLLLVQEELEAARASQVPSLHADLSSQGHQWWLEVWNDIERMFCMKTLTNSFN